MSDGDGEHGIEDVITGRRAGCLYEAFVDQRLDVLGECIETGLPD